MLRPTVNMSQAWLYLGTAAWFQSKALKLNKFLELSAITVIEKKTVRQTQIERERDIQTDTNGERERDMHVSLYLQNRISGHKFSGSKFRCP